MNYREKNKTSESCIALWLRNRLENPAYILHYFNAHIDPSVTHSEICDIRFEFEERLKDDQGKVSAWADLSLAFSVKSKNPAHRKELSYRFELKSSPKKIAEAIRQVKWYCDLTGDPTQKWIICCPGDRFRDLVLNERIGYLAAPEDLGEL